MKKLALIISIIASLVACRKEYHIETIIPETPRDYPVVFVNATKVDLMYDCKSLYDSRFGEVEIGKKTGILFNSCDTLKVWFTGSKDGIVVLNETVHKLKKDELTEVILK